MSKPGFELQWKAKLDNANRRSTGLGQGVTANGVTLFVPMTVVTGSSNNVYAIDNDTGYVVWQRHFDAPLPAATGALSRRHHAGADAHRQPRRPPAITLPNAGGGRAAQGYRSVIGQPGEGAPVEVRGGGAGRAGAAPAAGAPRGAGPGRQGRGDETRRHGRQHRAGWSGSNPGGAAAAPPRGGGGFGGPARTAHSRRDARAARRRPRRTRASLRRRLRDVERRHPARDGPASGKDIQRPAEFIPANARWSDAIAVNTTLYTTTSAGLRRRAERDLGDRSRERRQAGRLVEDQRRADRRAGGVHAPTARCSPPSVPPRGPAGSGKANAIVALDPKTLQVKDWFSAPGAEFVTGPSILRSEGHELVAAATKDGRLLVLERLVAGRRQPRHAARLDASRRHDQRGNRSPTGRSSRSPLHRRRRRHRRRLPVRPVHLRRRRSRRSRTARAGFSRLSRSPSSRSGLRRPATR